jgi:DNA-binding CsgD family transcriptional regulator
MLHTTQTLQGAQKGSASQLRRLVAEFCKLLGTQMGSIVPTACDDPHLSPRQRQTLQCLLTGDSEKEVANKLQISRHTVHIYVKELYKRYQVSSRGELLAKCLRSPNA